MTRTLKLKLGFSLFLVLFLWVEIAEARLYRGSGRSTARDQYSEATYFINNQYLNDMGVNDKYMDITHPDYESVSGLFSTVKSRVGGFNGVEAVPYECTKSVVAQDQFNLQSDIENLEFQLNDIDSYGEAYAGERAEVVAALAPLEEEYNRLYTSEPCVWEFEQGEDLFLWGAFDFYFGDADVQYDVNWTIAGNGQQWDLAGFINEDNGLTDPNTPTESIDAGSAMLSINAPLDLAPGEYALSVSVTLSSQTGGFLYSSINHPDGPYAIERQCRYNDEFDDYGDAYTAYEATISHLNNPEYDAALDNWILENPEPPSDICGYGAYQEIYGTSNNTQYELIRPLTELYSVSEMLRILPASYDIPEEVEANAPATFGMFLLSLVGIGARRTIKKRNAG